MSTRERERSNGPDDWQLLPSDDAPGQWWREYLTDHAEPNPPDWPTDLVPGDPDRDGLYEDFDGDGEINFPDVNEFFQRSDTDPVQSQADYFDYTGNWTISLQDVVALFRMV